MLTNMYAQVREEEKVISLQFIGSQQDVSMIGERSGSKSMMVLLSRNCPHGIHCIGFDYFLLKTLQEPGIVDCRESLSLFHLLLDWSGTGSFKLRLLCSTWM